MKSFSKVQKLTLTGFFVSIGIILPFATSHGFGIAGTVLLPMHIPVLLCGLICGPLCGLSCGLILPLLSSLLTAMPSIFPMTPIMTAELATYGFVSGLLFCKTRLHNYRFGVYASLLVAMLCGRIAYAAVFYALLIGFGSLKALSVGMALLTGLTGIIIQLLLIPPIVFLLRGNYMNKNTNAVESAKNLISAQKATCVVIKGQRILNIEYGRGIKPILSMYESGILDGADVTDKVVGRAAAYIMVLGGVKMCYALTVSRGALDVFERYGVKAEYESCVDCIINRAGTGLCPMEAATKDIDNPQDALIAVRRTLEALENK